jgi:hypothetical protein
VNTLTWIAAKGWEGLKSETIKGLQEQKRGTRMIRFCVMRLRRGVEVFLAFRTGRLDVNPGGVSVKGNVGC